MYVLPKNHRMKFRKLTQIGLALTVSTTIILIYRSHGYSKEQKNKKELLKGVKTNLALIRSGNQVIKPSELFNGKFKQDLNPGLHSNDSNTLQHGEEDQVIGDGASKLDVDDGAKEMQVKMEQEGDSPQEVAKFIGQTLVVDEQWGEGHHAGSQAYYHRIGDLVISHTKRIHLAVVICGDRIYEALVLFKSAILMTVAAKPLVIHMFAEMNLHELLNSQLESWPADVLERVEYRIYGVSFPQGENEEKWKELFKPCASQRLFLPTLLADIDSVIYVDVDILFLSPLEKLWAYFSRFNATQLVGLVPDQVVPEFGYYNHFARHPYVQPLGVNSGVMLMNLTRLRQSVWLPSMLKSFVIFWNKLPYGDQDLINIYLSYHPDQLYLLPCEWNYRQEHCKYRSVCKSAEENGVRILHGSKRSMQNNKQPAFAAIYSAFRDYHLGEDIATGLLERMIANLDVAKETSCGSRGLIFLKELEKTMQERSIQ